ncbi:MAG TPA: imidazole glycerol phosphate synthase subunit HisH [Anaerolineaceae bacterium]|jgi:glutamine amidotransferase|nr:imidazole glycerol phosphate synthase subunit HisH [Anaerolineaceae bacterium]
MIVIVDYGMGNLGSIQNMCRKIGHAALISSEAAEICRASRLILPGVGAFDHGMSQLTSLDLVDLLNDLVLQEHIPVLGVCLGMQLLTQGSAEGRLPGLGWLDARTVRFEFSPEQARLKIPHMGWNTVEFCRPSPLTAGFEGETRFYFVHSYHLQCHQPEDILGCTTYGYDFPSMVQRGNIMGAQFHPEKSHRFGMRLLRNFIEMPAC